MVATKSNARFAIEQLIARIERRRSGRKSVFTTYGFRPHDDWQAFYTCLWSATVYTVSHEAEVPPRHAARIVGESPFAVRAFW